MTDATLDKKEEAIAALLDGKVMEDTGRVAVSIRGYVNDFPAGLEAIFPTWPFGVMYTVELDVAEDEKRDAREAVRLGVYPRMGKGLFSIVTRLLLFEAKGQSVGDRRLEKTFSFNYDNQEIAERLVRYPGVADLILKLEHSSNFSELIIRSDVGVYLAQPTSFKGLDLESCRLTFNALGSLAEILFEGF